MSRPRLSPFAPVVVLLPLALLALACGYALVGHGTNVPPTIQKVYLSPLQNTTRRSELEQILTRALSEELVARKRFTMVTDVTQADATLSGSIIGFDVAPLTFDPQGRATQYQISILVSMLFKDKADKVIWQNEHYVYKEAYSVDPSATSYFDRERTAIQDASGRFARTVIIDLLEGF